METVELTAEEFRSFQEYIYQHSGIRIPETKRSMLSNRIRRRLRATGITSFQEYFDFLTSVRGQTELGDFLNAVTTNETFFFRTLTHFEWFRDEFLREMSSRPRAGEHARQIRVWSAACSTGEEPYSLALCLAEKIWTFKDWTLQILGTDISDDVLATAREAVFKERALELVTDSQRRRYFQKQKDGSGWKLRDEIKGLVEFRRHNLMKRLVLPPFDCIFIRNVLIYFDRESKQTAVRQLIQSLADGGYLVVGPSEGVHDLLGDLKRHQTFLYQKVPSEGADGNSASR